MRARGARHVQHRNTRMRTHSHTYTPGEPARGARHGAGSCRSCCGQGSVLQRVAACCSVLQCVAVCCSVLQCVAVCGVLQCVAVVCNFAGSCRSCCWQGSVLQRVAACCSMLQCVAVCSVLQCVALCCSLLQFRRLLPPLLLARYHHIQLFWDSFFRK